MLLNLLPGLRDLRTPLAVGFLWLAIAWVLVGEQIQESSLDSTTLAGRIREQLDSIPAPLGYGALVFVAYLIGAGLCVLAPPRWLDREVNSIDSFYLSEVLRRQTGYVAPELENSTLYGHLPQVMQVGISRVWKEWPTDDGGRVRPPRWTKPWLLIPARVRHRVAVWLQEQGLRNLEDGLQSFWQRLRAYLEPPLDYSGLGGRLSNLISMRIERATRDGGSVTEILNTDALSPVAQRGAADYINHMYALAPDDQDAYGAESASSDVIQESIIRGLQDDLDSVASRLQVEHESLYNKSDRLRAESEFRIGVSLPLAVLSVAVFYQFNLDLSLLGLPFAAALFVQGWKRMYQAEAVLWTCVIYSIVEIPDLDALKNLSLPANRTPEVVWDESREEDGPQDAEGVEADQE